MKGIDTGINPTNHDKLAALGAFAIARLVFEPEDEIQIYSESIQPTIERLGLGDLAETSEARQLIDAYNLDPSDAGDTAPDFIYHKTAHSGCLAEEFEERYRDYHDAERARLEGKAHDDEPLQEAQLLIDALMKYAGITLK